MPSLSKLRPLWLLVGLCASPIQAASPTLVDDLLGLSGTVLIFDHPAVIAALASPNATDPGILLSQASFRPWAGARIWLLEANNGTLRGYQPSTDFQHQADRRGLILNTTSPLGTELSELQTLLRQKPLDNNALRDLLRRQQSEAIVLLGINNEHVQWRLISPEVQTTANVGSQALSYLPHLWAESLAINWQWPALGQAALVEVQGLTTFARFKYVERNLGTLCRSPRLLRLQDSTADFSCPTDNAQLPERLGLTPQLAPVPLQDHALDEALLMGRQLSQRYAIYRWTE